MAVVWIAAVAQVQSLAQEFLHTVDMAKKKKKKKKKRKKKKFSTISLFFQEFMFLKSH